MPRSGCVALGTTILPSDWEIRAKRGVKRPQSVITGRCVCWLTTRWPYGRHGPERWLRGLRHPTDNRAIALHVVRGFESHPFRLFDFLRHPADTMGVQSDRPAINRAGTPRVSRGVFFAPLAPSPRLGSERLVPDLYATQAATGLRTRAFPTLTRHRIRTGISNPAETEFPARTGGCSSPATGAASPAKQAVPVWALSPNRPS